MINLRNNVSKAREHRVQLRMRGRIERGMRNQLVTEFERLARETSIDVNSIEPAITAHEARLERILGRWYRVIFEEFGGRTLARIKPAAPGKSDAEHELETKAKLRDEYAVAVEKFTKRWTARKAAQISNTSRAKIERVVRAGTIEGLGEREIARQIQEKIAGSMGRRRAMTIARTETHSASQDAAFELVQTAGIDVVKEWIAVEDDRTREDHAEANGQIVQMHERFKIGDDELLYPGDPSGPPDEVINCRCVCAYNPVKKA